MKKRSLMFFVLAVILVTSLLLGGGFLGMEQTIAFAQDGPKNKTSFSCDDVTGITTAECNALTVFYSTTNGENWTIHTGWLETITPCSWYGITCANGQVTGLSERANNLTGQIPTELTNLIYLKNLALDGNQLSGSIPSSIGSLINLEYLRLGSNNLSGSIPKELGTLTQTRVLTLGKNLLTGYIPPELGNMTSLTWLALDQNQLSGGIPPELGNLINLIELYLSSNSFVSIPPEIKKLTKLQKLEIGSNQISNIPIEIGDLDNLKILSLGENQITGDIPSELGNLLNLNYLWLSDNQFTGNIPNSFGNLSNLWELNLSNNQLSGGIPSELGSLINIFGIYLNGNKFSGTLPQEIGNLSNLVYLYLYENQINGSIPLSFINLSNLSFFYYDSTNLCAPSDMTFQTWFTSVPYVTGTWTCLSAPVLLNPINLIATNDTTPTFKWDMLNNAVSYQLMVDNNSGFTSPEYNKTGILGISKALPTAIAEGAYYWRVRAKDPGGNWSPWSTKWKFTVDTTPPGKVILLTPANGSNTTDRTPTFTWNAVTGAKYYQLVVDDTADFSSPVYTSAWMTGTSKTWGTPLAPKLYYWKVKARDAAGNLGAWSTVWKVTVN